MYQNCVLPVTTNAYVSANVSISNVLNANLFPMYNLGAIRYETQSTANQSSERVMGARVCAVCTFPFFLFASKLTNVSVGARDFESGVFT